VKDARDFIPWQVTDISIRPYDDFWSFNPSIHFDGTTWRCVLRCCDYAMPDGVTVRSKTARPTGQQTKNAMVILDPVSWKPITIFKMHERDGYARASTPHVGYEDMRIFWTDKAGIQGVAASLHLKRDREGRQPDGTPQHQPPEQVLLSFDDAYNIVAARPIRGDGWSGTPQKNWVPFDGCVEPRFLYSIDKGTMFDDRGTVHGDAAIVRPSIARRSAGEKPIVTPQAVIDPQPDPQPASPEPPPPQEPQPPRPVERDPHPPQPKPVDRRIAVRRGDVQVARGRRLSLDAGSVRTASTSQAHRVRADSGSTRLIGAGRVRVQKYGGLRGGTQLVQVGENAWLGVGHDMQFVGGKKLYWHTWYVVDSRGKMTATSEPMKLAKNGIEFAAGMGIDGDRVVVSFGVDDMECRIGETRLEAVMSRLHPVDR
jgi:hypothetical protein